MRTMISRKTRNETATMLPDTLDQVGCYANVQDTVPLIGKHVDARLPWSHVAYLRQRPVYNKPLDIPQVRRPGERRDPATSYATFSRLQPCVQ